VLFSCEHNARVFDVTWPCQSISSFWIPMPRAKDFRNQQSGCCENIYRINSYLGEGKARKSLPIFQSSLLKSSKESRELSSSLRASFEVFRWRKMNNNEILPRKELRGKIFHFVYSQSFHNILRLNICRERVTFRARTSLSREKNGRSVILCLINTMVIFYVTRMCKAAIFYSR